MVDNQNKDKVVNIKPQEVELPTFDVMEYINKKAIVNKVEYREGQNGHYAYVEAQVLEAEFNGEPVRATRILGLGTDKDGNIGWGKDTKTGVFLKDMKVPDIDSLMGKEVISTFTLAKDGKKYLTF